MVQVVEPSNMRRAYKRVLKNRGAAGVDRLTVEELKDWLLVHWSSVKTALLEDQYLPRAVRRVDIPKPNGGVRTLGVPTVVDRLIQQALHQVLQPIFESTFSEGSFGFRPQRSALDAVAKAKEYAPESLRRLMDRVRELLRKGRGRSLPHTIEVLNPVLRGWANYFRLTANMRTLDDSIGGCVENYVACSGGSGKPRRPENDDLSLLGLDPSERGNRALMGEGLGGTRHPIT